jgi:hypothetical protein
MEIEESPTMTKPAIISGALILAMTAAVILQHEASAARREENRLLRQRLAQTNVPEEVNPQRVALSPATIPSPSDDRAAESARLSAEIEKLKRELAETTQMAERDRTALAQAQASQTTAETDLEEKLRHTKRNLSDWGAAWTAYAGKNNGQFPLSFDEARPFLPDDSGKEDDLVPSQFDIVYQGSVSNLDNPNQIIVLRQKEAVQTPGNANWLRTYLFADGRCETQSTSDGNFEAWEVWHEAPNP